MNKNKIILLTILSLLAIIAIIITCWIQLVSVTSDWFLKLLQEDNTELGVTIPPLRSLPVEAQIRRIFGKDAQMAIAIFTAESHLRCDAVSSTGDYGPAQINTIHTHRWPLEQIKDCTENLKIAKVLFDEAEGFYPWNAYTNGSYKQYLR